MRVVVAHFDLNGSLDKAERIRQEEWRNAAHEVLPERLGLEDVDFDPAIFHVSLGLAGRDVVAAVAASMCEAGYCVSVEDLHAVYERRREILTRDGYERDGYPLKEGAADLLRSMHGLGVKLTVVTSETEGHAMRSLTRAGLDPLITGIVGRDTLVDDQELLRKPHPAPYLTAKSRVEALHPDCNVIHYGHEDTATGMLAVLRAKGAGEFQGAIHVKDIQDLDTIIAQMQRALDADEPHLKAHQVPEMIDLRNANYEEIEAFYRHLIRRSA